MKTFRAVVIGAGAIARDHMGAMSRSDRTVLAAIADIDRDRASELARSYGVKPYTDYREMIREERADIVVIALPHYLHKEVAIWCMSQGCHVLLEKPMAMNVEECDEINAAAVRYNVAVAVGHMQHYFPVNIKAREIVASGRLGRLVMMQERRHSHYFRPERPDWFLKRSQSGGGIVMNLGSHSIDKIQWLTGSPVTSVRASMTYYAERGDVEGSACLFIQTRDGITAAVSLCGYPGNIRIHETDLLFTGGQLKIQGQTQLWIRTEDGSEQQIDTSGQADPFTAQWADVLDNIEHGSSLSISGTYGRSVSAVIAAAYRSHETGREQAIEHPLLV